MPDIVQLSSSKAPLLSPETGGKSCALDERSCTHTDVVDTDVVYKFNFTLTYT